MLTLENVSVNYGAIEALRGVSMRVEKGEVVTLIGANGAGKTTTLRTITGLLAPTQGRITFEEESIGGMPAHKLVARGISMSPEGRGVFANLSVRENLQMGAYLQKDKRQIAADMEKVFQRFPRLKERESQKAGTLSGGEQQMLAIARALMSRPRLLLLDEPSLGLAPRIVHTIFEAVDEIRAEGTTILLVEQNAHAALQAFRPCLRTRDGPDRYGRSLEGARRRPAHQRGLPGRVVVSGNFGLRIARFRILIWNFAIKDFELSLRRSISNSFNRLNPQIRNPKINPQSAIRNPNYPHRSSPPDQIHRYSRQHDQ